MSVPNKILNLLKRNALQADETIALLKRQLSLLEKEARSDKLQSFYEVDFVRSLIAKLPSRADLQNSAELLKLTEEQADKRQKEDLRKENEELKKRVKRLKQDLVQVELQNGQTIVPLPHVKEETIAEPVKSEKVPVAQMNEKPVREEKPAGKAKKEKTSAKPNASARENAEEKIDASRMELRVGKIVKVQEHPDADALYLEEIDVGEDKPRTVVSGLVKHIPIEKMQDRMVLMLCNLKPAKMRGVVSQAMVMCASSPERVEILDPPPGAVPGDKVICEGYPGTPDNQLSAKKKMFEKIQPDLHTDEACIAKYKGSPFVIVGKDGYFKSQTMKNSGIK